jgi:dipeptidyl aminopeptidase/acylaminoacyl peptidase
MNDQGVECFGDLVYPPDFQPGRRYPLIVVQYESRGFLRGGTGDEYPIQIFAREGYLVLSIQRPRSPLFGKGLSTTERQRQQNEGFLERRSILSAIETKVKQLIDTGLADPQRIGITGLSDGSTTVQYAALHSSLFSAASVSGCCWEPSQTWLLGPSLQNTYQGFGWPRSPQDKPAMWADISLSRNADRVTFPLLFQAADGEYLMALEAVSALREAGSPVDLFVYPDELHIKRHPAHRAGVYQRNLLWFDFWLRGKKPPAGDPRAAEVDRWTQMKKSWEKSTTQASVSRRADGG